MSDNPATDMHIAPESDLRGIQDVARELGVTMRTLRYYEDRGLVQPQRIGTMRIYTKREFARMQLILRGKRLGFSIREIGEFLNLYNVDPEHREQTQQLVKKVSERRRKLERQQVALQQTLEELKLIERQALAALEAGS